MKRYLLIPVALAVLTAATAVKAQNKVRGLEPAFLDTTCAPCRDFYQYANGGWLKTATIPAAYSSWGVTEELNDFNEESLHQLLEQAARDADHAPDENARKLGVFYGTCMDSEGAEALGMQPLRPVLERIKALKSKDEVPTLLAELHAIGTGGFFGFGVRQDPKNSSRYIVTAGQGGLGMPDRDFYFRKDSVSAGLRAEYLAHVERTFKLIGTDPAASHAAAGRVMEIETAMASASMTRVQRRDPNATYHLMPVKDAQALSPLLHWDAYLKASGLDSATEMNVSQPAFFHVVDSLLQAVTLDDWKTYLTWNAASDASPYLDKTFDEEYFSFARLLSGAKERLPRWKRCLSRTDSNLGEALGKYYTDRYFSPAAKTTMLDLVAHLKTELRRRLLALDWMEEPTRREALAKLDAFGRKIGYPDQWRDYSALEVKPGPFLENLQRSSRFEARRRLSRFGKPVDRSEWNMTPPTVNAYYSSSNNEIVFPAGILQPPYFDVDQEDVLNYGQTGAVIGHEMTHGFDDSGRKFDSHGNLRAWWTPADSARYRERAQKVVEQFNEIVAVDDLHINGALTQGENIADLGGLFVAYSAMEDATQGKPRALVGGFTPEQRFFIAYAQSWRETQRPESIRNQVTTDPHSPDKWRVNAPLSNFPEFAKAFGCKAGDPMVRAENLRTRIW